jgi:5-methylcytosine-specific restriction enzyme A
MTGWSDKGSRHARGYGTAWTKLRLVILKRDSYLCQACKLEGRTTPAREVDHITPKAKGGTDDPSNLVAICREHHKAKTAKEAAEAQGRTLKDAPRFDASGRVVW